jgi:hypothetical protein
MLQIFTMAGEILSENRIPENNITSNRSIKRVCRTHFQVSLMLWRAHALGHSVSPREMALPLPKNFRPPSRSEKRVRFLLPSSPLVDRWIASPSPSRSLVELSWSWGSLMVGRLGVFLFPICKQFPRVQSKKDTANEVRIFLTNMLGERERETCKSHSRRCI